MKSARLDLVYLVPDQLKGSPLGDEILELFRKINTVSYNKGTITGYKRGLRDRKSPEKPIRASWSIGNIFK